MTRRRALATIGAGAAMTLGIGGISGTALGWKRTDVEFKGCSEVWVVVHPDDLEYGNDDDSAAPYPAVAHVIVADSDGDLDCRVLEFTPETATNVSGHYGSAAVVKYAPPSDEKVLGVIIYNYTPGEDRFSRESPLVVNGHRCANTPGTPDPRDAPCADNTYTRDREDENYSPDHGNDGKDDWPGNSDEPGAPGESNDEHHGNDGRPDDTERPDDDERSGKWGRSEERDGSNDERSGKRKRSEERDDSDDERPKKGRRSGHGH